ncbi:MAG: DEAD/DEAH box helicase [Solobacterium sp.]|nr:DEAD/DEAH box helicase [Solobacterium sp.]
MSWQDKFNDWELEKGRDYFEMNKVLFIDRDNNIFTAQVAGSDYYSEYKVTTVINNKGEVTAQKCTCPRYRDKGYCKHIIATLFEIEKVFPDVLKGSYKDTRYTYINNPKSDIDIENLMGDYYMSEETYKRAKTICLNKTNMILDNKNFYDDDVAYNFLIGSGRDYVNFKFTANRIILFNCHCQECMRRPYYERYKLCANKAASLMMVEDYFVDHKFDKTNRLGQNFLDYSKEKRSSNIMGRSESIHLIPSFTFDKDKDEYLIKFKAGKDKLLNIKDLSYFIDCYKRSAKYDLSTKVTLDFSKDDIAEDSKALFKYLEDYIEESNSFYNYVNCRYYVAAPPSSYISLEKNRMDKLFDLSYGRQVELIYKEYDEKTKSLINLSIVNNDLPITISPEIVDDELKSVTISHPPFSCFSGEKYKYLIGPNKFSRILNDNEIVDVIYGLNGNDIKIGAANLGDFYYDILPKLKTYQNLIIEDEDKIIKNVPVRPVFKFYLDALDGLVTCKCDVYYKEDKYNLLDKTGTRDFEREKNVLEYLLNDFEEYNDDELCIRNDECLYHLLTSLNELREYGEVFSTARFDSLGVKKKVKVSVGVRVQSDLLNLNLISDLERDELLAVLSSYKQKKKYHRLRSGEFVDMNDKDLDKLLSLKEEMNITDKKFLKEDIKLPSYRILSLNEELNEFENIDVKRDKHFNDYVKRFENIDISSYELPKDLNADLRSYQVYGFKWLNVLYDCGFGGILADEMGLGKTLQVISLLAYRNKEKIKSLIVTPASLVYNWYAEFNKFAPFIKVGMVVGNKDERSALLTHRHEYDVLITSYDLLKRDIDLYSDISFDVEIIDEAQYIKNQTTGAAKAVKEIDSKKRFALTGTPIENRLSELWSIFNYLMPDYLYSYEYFRKHFESPIVNDGDEYASNMLKKMIGPFILRRRKMDVLKDLPEKIERVYYANFDSRQKEIYDAQVMKISKLVENEDEKAFSTSKIAILAELMKVRQICCDPSLLLEDYKGGSAKKDTCLQLIEESIDGGHKLLVFSQFTSMLEILEEELNKKKIAYYKITGATDKKERLELCNKFNKDDVKVFLISLKAGGTGLNLIGADIVIHYDPWWNEAVISQATDRTHRIGQTNTVTVYKLIAKDTLEEKILKLQEDKQNLADEILSGANASLSSMSKDELLELLNGN